MGVLTPSFRRGASVESLDALVEHVAGNADRPDEELRHGSQHLQRPVLQLRHGVRLVEAAPQGRTRTAESRGRNRFSPASGRHQGTQSGTTLHQISQGPGSSGFLPSFLPEKKAQRS